MNDILPSELCVYSLHDGLELWALEAKDTAGEYGIVGVDYLAPSGEKIIQLQVMPSIERQ